MKSKWDKIWSGLKNLIETINMNISECTKMVENESNLNKSKVTKLYQKNIEKELKVCNDTIEQTKLKESTLNN